MPPIVSKKELTNLALRGKAQFAPDQENKKQEADDKKLESLMRVIADAIKESTDKSSATLLSALQDNRAALGLLARKSDEPAQETSVAHAWKFDFERDEQGRIARIIARPIERSQMH